MNVHLVLLNNIFFIFCIFLFSCMPGKHGYASILKIDSDIIVFMGVYKYCTWNMNVPYSNIFVNKKADFFHYTFFHCWITYFSKHTLLFIVKKQYCIWQHIFFSKEPPFFFIWL